MGDSRLVDPVIRPYHETDAPDVVRLSLRARAPVFASESEVMGDEIFERLYGDDWRRKQQKDVEKVLADEETEAWVAEVNGEAVGFVAAALKIDRGMGAERPVYVASLASVLEPGGVLHLLCFSDRQPGVMGPRRVKQGELRDSFADGWEVVEIVATTFVANILGGEAQAWRATISLRGRHARERA